MKKLILSVAALTIAMMSYGQTQCEGLTKDSVQCKNTVKTKVKLCHIHNPNHIVLSNSVAVICSGTTKKNKKNSKMETKSSEKRVENKTTDKITALGFKTATDGGIPMVKCK